MQRVRHPPTGLWRLATRALQLNSCMCPQLGGAWVARPPRRCIPPVPSWRRQAPPKARLYTPFALQGLPCLAWPFFTASDVPPYACILLLLPIMLPSLVCDVAQRRAGTRFAVYCSGRVVPPTALAPEDAPIATAALRLGVYDRGQGCSECATAWHRGLALRRPPLGAFGLWGRSRAP